MVGYDPKKAETGVCSSHEIVLSPRRFSLIFCRLLLLHVRQQTKERLPCVLCTGAPSILQVSSIPGTSVCDTYVPQSRFDGAQRSRQEIASGGVSHGL